MHEIPMHMHNMLTHPPSQIPHTCIQVVLSGLGDETASVSSNIAVKELMSMVMAGNALERSDC